MLTKPEISDTVIAEALRVHHGHEVRDIEFLPLGADGGTFVFKVNTADGRPYFLKLRRGDFAEIAVSVPAFLRTSGIDAVMAPIATAAGQLSFRTAEYASALYPFLDGKDGYAQELSPEQWVALGKALRSIHNAKLPSKIAGHVPADAFTSETRAATLRVDACVARRSYEDSTAAGFAALWLGHRGSILSMVHRAEVLASRLRGRALPKVLCHGDLHPGNLLLDGSDGLSIVDWDEPVIAPRECDLLFFGGGAAGTRNSAAADALFYEGYGEVDIDAEALAFHHYERILRDLTATAEQLLESQGSIEDRELSLRQMAVQFEPGRIVEVAHRSYETIRP